MGHVSCWYEEKQKADLYRMARPGDLIEFDRGAYKHWAVFSGSMTDFGQILGVPFSCSSCGRDKDNCRCVRFYVVHRANPTDSSPLNFLMRSQSVGKGLHGIGNVILECMDSVWSGCKARKNNIFDPQYPAIPGNRVLGRAFQVFHKHAKGKGGNDEYNLITNNCEHFACWCRYGRKESTQINRGALVLGVTTVSAVAGVTAACGNGVPISIPNPFAWENKDSPRRRTCPNKRPDSPYPFRGILQSNRLSFLE